MTSLGQFPWKPKVFFFSMASTTRDVPWSTGQAVAAQTRFIFSADALPTGGLGGLRECETTSPSVPERGSAVHVDGSPAPL